MPGFLKKFSGSTSIFLGLRLKCIVLFCAVVVDSLKYEAGVGKMNHGVSLHAATAALAADSLVTVKYRLADAAAADPWTDEF